MRPGRINGQRTNLMGNSQYFLIQNFLILFSTGKYKAEKNKHCYEKIPNLENIIVVKHLGKRLNNYY